MARATTPQANRLTRNGARKPRGQKAPVAPRTLPTVLGMKSSTSPKSAPVVAHIIAADGRDDDTARMQDLIGMLLKLKQNGVEQ
jgi:hypothetical protein